MSEEQVTNENYTDEHVQTQQDGGQGQDASEQGSELQQLMQSKGYTSEADFIRDFTNLEKRNTRLQREMSELNRGDVNAGQQSAPSQESQPTDAFFNDFVKNPEDVLKNKFEQFTQPLVSELNQTRVENALLYLTSQKDYYEGMEDDLSDVIYENRDRVYSLRDGSRAQLGAMHPLDKVKLALQIHREKETKTNTAQTVKPPQVLSPKKSSAPLDNKNDKELTSDEFRKKYGLQVSSE